MRDGELDVPRRRFVLSRRAFGLRTRIAGLLGLIVFALSASLSGVIGAASIYDERQSLGTSVANDADRFAERLNKEMADRAREIELISSLGPVSELPVSYPVEKDAVQALLERLQRSFPAYTWIGVTDPAGRVLAATGGVLEGVNVSARSSVHDVLTARQHDSADSTQQARSLIPNDPGRVMDLVHPVTNADGSVADVVFAQITWDWIAELANSVVTPNTQGNERETFLVASDNTILMGPGDVIGQMLTLPVIDRARAGYSGWSVETWPDGQSYLTGASYAAGEGLYPGPGSQRMQWVTLVREPVGLAFRPAIQLRNDILLTGIVLALVFALLGWFIAGRISAPLARMAATAERLRQGDDVEMPLLQGAFEIESLSVSLRALVASLTRKQIALDEMEQLTLRDPLTGLLNRSGLRKHLDRAMLHAREAKISLLVFLGDLDGFKQVNDVEGHAAGDAVLCEVASRLQSCVRHYDAVARFGGDEFVLVLEANDAADPTALAIARRVMEAVSAPCWIGRQVVHVGCSFGGAAWPQDGDDVDTVIAKADAALYAVKRGGKGKLLLHGAWMGNQP